MAWFLIEIRIEKEFRKNGEEIVALESCLLQTLGFNVLVQHAHTVIIKTCQMIKGISRKSSKYWTNKQFVLMN